MLQTHFLLSENQKLPFFLSAPKCLPPQLGCWLILLLSGAISPCLTHARGHSGRDAGIEGKSWALLSCSQTGWKDISILSCLSSMPSGKCCSSSLLLFYTVRAGLLITPGQLSCGDALGMGMTSALQQVGDLNAGSREKQGEAEMSLTALLNLLCTLGNSDVNHYSEGLCSLLSHTGFVLLAHWYPGNHSALTDWKPARLFIHSKAVHFLGYSLTAIRLAHINSNRLHFLQVWMVKLR